MNRWIKCLSSLMEYRTLMCALMSCLTFVGALRCVHAEAPSDWREAFANVRSSMVTVIVPPSQSDPGDPLSNASPYLSPFSNWNVSEVQNPATISDAQRAEIRKHIVDISGSANEQQKLPIVWRLLYNASRGNGDASTVLGLVEKRPSQINGTVFSADGIVVAMIGNESVGDVQVMLPSGELVQGKVKMFDEVTGASLIDLGRSAESCGLKPLEISDEALDVGLPVGAAWKHAESKGIAAGVGIVSSDEILLGNEAMPVVETDIAIRDDAAGGVIVNSRGKCVGVVYRMASVIGDTGNAYAIPIAVLKPLIEHAHNHESQYLYRGRIGVAFEERSNRITTILPETPAQKAGLQPSDRIVRVRSKEVQEGKDAILELSRLRAGDKASFVVDRNGTKIEFELELASKVDTTKTSEPSATSEDIKSETGSKPSDRSAKVGNAGPNANPATQPTAQPPVPPTRFQEQPEAYYRVLQVERTNIEASLQKLMSEITKLREELKAIRETKK